MPEVGLDLDLASQLVLRVRLLQLLLEKNLEGDDVLALLLAGQVNVAEFAATQGLAYIEVAQLRGGGAVGCQDQDKDVYRALCTLDFPFCVSVCDGAGDPPRAVDARRKRECVVGARYFADIRSIRTCHRFSSCFSGSLVLAGAAAAREAVAFSLPASPEVVAPGPA